MRKHTCVLYLLILAIPTLLIAFSGCSLTRSDLLEIATAQPDIHITPDVSQYYSFGSVEVYDVSKQTFYIENQGMRTLTIEKLYTSNEDMKEFIVDATYTSSNVEPGESTTFDLYFKPSSDMLFQEDLFIESNDPEERIYRFNISGLGSWGSGNPPMMTVLQGISPVSLGSVAYDFGAVNVGSSAYIDFTIMNDSRADYDLAVTSITFGSGDFTQFNRIATSLPTSLSPGAGMNFTVQFLPGNVLTYMAELEIITDDPNYSSFSFYVTGTGRADPDIRVLDGSNEIITDGTVSFGTATYNQSEITKFINVENTGSVDLYIYDIIVDDIDGDFSLTSPLSTDYPLTISPGGSSPIALRFKPVSGVDMLLQAEIEIYSDDPDESPCHFYVEGYSEGIQIPDIDVTNETTGNEVPSSSLGYDFGTVGIDTFMTTTFKIKNRGNADLTLFEINISGDTNDFYLSNTPTLPEVITPGASVLFDATYLPQDTGIHVASVYIENDDPDALECPYIFDLQGTGSVKDVPEIQVEVGNKKILNGSIYYFNDMKSVIKYTESLTETFTIENKGETALIISGLLMVGKNAEDFTSDLITPVTVMAGSNLNFNINFSPKSVPSELEELSTQVQISNNTADQDPFEVEIVGFVGP